LKSEIDLFDYSSRKEFCRSSSTVMMTKCVTMES